MMLEPVGLADIARRAQVRPDTAKKWVERHDHFPRERGRAGGRRLWEWSEVHRWLISTGRAPHIFRYREDGGPGTILALVLDGDDQWRPIARFTDVNDDPDDVVGDWRATPTRHAIEDMDGDRAAAQEWADRLLKGWDEARIRWVREHPDEPMPAHLVGYPHDLSAEPPAEPESEPEPDWVWLAERN